jgi:hypothetical protein
MGEKGETVSELFGIVPKNQLEQIRVEAKEYKGHPIVDVRIYRRSSSTSDDWYPTKRGIALNPEFVGQLVSVLERVVDPGAI